MWKIVILVVIVVGLIVDTIRADGDDFYADLGRLDEVLENIHKRYVEDINTTDLVDHAVKGMLDILDPHTSFFKEKEYEELRIHTEGKFGGLGIQISVRDKLLTVVTPISGTPASRAGIQSGDQIFKIDSKSTKGITIEEAVEKLRGEPGSEVSISIKRKGEIKPLEFTITREIITIKAVPYYGVLDKDIGYIKLVTFSQDAGQEVEKALKELMEKDIEGLILDLRRNPGGLLPQAIEVSEKFLDRKSLVVSTRGRLRHQNNQYKSKFDPVIPKDIPVAVLVNTASASASEIVAGAIQDWDRGVIIGDTTFGKGSVQSVFPVDNRGHHLKLTTAFYYTPSGRCINKSVNDIPESDNGEQDSSQALSDSSLSDTVTTEAPKDTMEYRTRGGRIVYGGGGIIPDTIVEQPDLKPLVRELFIKDIYFKFTNHIFPVLQKESVAFDNSFAVDKNLIEQFYTFLDSVEFEYKSHARNKFVEFTEWAGLQPDTIKDSTMQGKKKTTPEWDAKELEILKAASAKVEQLLKKKDRQEFEENEKEIKTYLREALLGRGLGQDNELVYRTILKREKSVLAAIDILSDRKGYRKLLNTQKE